MARPWRPGVAVRDRTTVPSDTVLGQAEQVSPPPRKTAKIAGISHKEEFMAQDLFDLHGRVAVVTGGTTGLGYAISLGLAGAGAHVIPTSRRQDQVSKIAG